MKLRVVFHIVGLTNLILSGTMLVPLFVSLFFEEGDTSVFLISAAVTAAVGLMMYLPTRGGGHEVSHRHGFVIVAMCWLSASFFGSLPFAISGAFPSFVDALFEGVSGLTTTGASVLADIEGTPHGILFWRNFIHWLGGMGIVILGLAVLPLLGVGGMQIYKAEASVVASDKLAPRVREIARILIKVYLMLSFVLMVFYIMAGMDIFDAFVHSFSTISTGGFSNRGTSIGHYGNYFVELVTIVFMVLGGTSFALHYRFFGEGFRAYARNSEFKFYIGVLALFVVLVGANLYFTSFYDGVAESLRFSSFQVVSIMTTTGYSTADFAAWPAFSQILLMLLMFFGGTAGSTAGSVKCIRLLLLFKLGYREVYKLIHPHAVKPIKMNGRTVPQDVLNAVTGFTFLYLAVFVISSAVLAFQGIDFVTAVSSAAASISCVGPALGSTGPLSNFAGLPTLSKCVLIADMLLGRLELYTVLILLLPSFWRG